jgi:hypothetical protein
MDILNTINTNVFFIDAYYKLQNLQNTSNHKSKPKLTKKQIKHRKASKLSKKARARGNKNK